MCKIFIRVMFWMVKTKKIRISKFQEHVPFSAKLGFEIWNLVKKGYSKFEIVDEENEVLIRTWRVAKHG